MNLLKIYIWRTSKGRHKGCHNDRFVFASYLSTKNSIENDMKIAFFTRHTFFFLLKNLVNVCGVTVFINVVDFRANQHKTLNKFDLHHVHTNSLKLKRSRLETWGQVVFVVFFSSFRMFSSNLCSLHGLPLVKSAQRFMSNWESSFWHVFHLSEFSPKLENSF